MHATKIFLTLDPSPECTVGSVRLTGGNSTVEGLVELCIDGEWSNVCDQGWDAFDASVTCKQLNLPYTGICCLVCIVNLGLSAMLYA